MRTLSLTGAVSALVLSACATPSHAPSAPIVQPGAPGHATQEVGASAARDTSHVRYSDADVKFMQGMIQHHAQALEMVQLLYERTQSDAMRQLAKRIELSQADEITMMRNWLRARGVPAPDPTAHHDMPGMAGMVMMPGMLTADEMKRLASLHGAAFDRAFLQGMITHHAGALTMVSDLLATPRAGQDSDIFAFASDVDADQRAEIARMRAMLQDPRVGLKPGLHDAGSAIAGLELIASLPKPAGFKDTSGLNFANSDIAFRRTDLFLGNFNGFNIYDIADARRPTLRASVVCPGGQGDMSVYGNLLFMSVEQTRGRIDCGTQGVERPSSPDRFRGVRIFDISDVRKPKQIAAVQTCRGSHTHTLVTTPNDKENVYIYGSGTGPVRPADELAGCSGKEPNEDPNTALFSIDVIQVPLAHPEQAKLVNRPRIFADPSTGAINGLWPGGMHGEGTQTTAVTNECHDITVFPEAGLAAAACAGNGILLDISDPVHPRRLDEVTDSHFAYWHSATFNNDGTKVVFTDEWGGGVRPHCLASDPPNWGADAIFDISEKKLVFRGYFKMPAPQTEQENCVAHNGSIVPVPGRDIMAQAWYQGGVSLFDFTDSAHPFEIAYFDRGPIDRKELVIGGYWSAYWYNGAIYGSEIARGLDVFRLKPSEFLSENEIAAASLVHLDVFNPQDQPKLGWPSSFVIARAFLDQLSRARAIDPARASAVRTAIDRADRAEPARAALDELERLAAEIERDIGAAAGQDRARLRFLAETLRARASKLHGTRPFPEL